MCTLYKRRQKVQFKRMVDWAKDYSEKGFAGVPEKRLEELKYLASLA